jgi:signal transduction histidine kinase
MPPRSLMRPIDASHFAHWLAAIFLFFATVGTATAEPRRILFLNSYGPNFSPFSEYTAVLRTELARRSPQPVDIYDASLASARFAEDDREGAFLNYLVSLFAGRSLDLVVTIGAPAARFAQRYRSQLFPSVPLLITAVERRRLNPDILSENDAVVATNIDLRRVFDDILQILPETTAVAVVVGSSPNEKFWSQQLQRDLNTFPSRVRLIWLNDLSLDEIKKRLADLPPNSAIFFGLLNVDGAGVPYEGTQALSSIRPVANAPIFSYVSAHLGQGIVGGALIPIEDVGRLAADAAVRILRGEAPGSIRPAAIGLGTPMFDWRELRRWNIAEASLPPGSLVKFRQPTVWEAYRWQLSFIAAITLLQAALITGLLLEQRRRRMVEVESDRRLVQLAHINRTAAVSAISASIAHEINQPLAAILNNAEAAEIVLSRSPLNIDLLNEILADIRRADQRASGIVAGLRRLLKSKDTERQVVDLNDVIPNVIQLLSPEAKAHNVELLVDCASGKFPVRADSIQLEQILLNLGLNAVQAISNSGLAKRNITFKAATAENSAVQVSISDTGSGIAADKLEGVFEPFFTTKPDGTGLGLSIVRTIVEAYGGKIRADNNASGGATFFFTLPLANRSTGAA